MDRYIRTDKDKFQLILEILDNNLEVYLVNNYEYILKKYAKLKGNKYDIEREMHFNFVDDLITIKLVKKGVIVHSFVIQTDCEELINKCYHYVKQYIIKTDGINY